MSGRRRIHRDKGIAYRAAVSGMYCLAAAAVDVGAGAAHAIHQADWVGSKNCSAARGIAHGDRKTANHNVIIPVARLDSDVKSSSSGVRTRRRDNREVIE